MLGIRHIPRIVSSRLGLCQYSTKNLTQQKFNANTQNKPKGIVAAAFKNLKEDKSEETLQKASLDIEEAIVKAKSKNEWLTHVWTLALLGVVENSQLQLVLSEKFIKDLIEEQSGKALLPNINMKLLNLNAYSKLIAKDFKGQHLPETSKIFEVPIAHSKSKQIITNSMLDAFKSLVLSGNNVKSLVNTNMGFLI
uniref:FAST kinase-like protein subdomain 2 domain-containing protein n=1 Tax=Megaselia scalaris TaxID=36166 RepID=T1GY11_MEGSC